MFCIFVQFIVAYIYGHLSLKYHVHEFFSMQNTFFEPVSFYILSETLMSAYRITYWALEWLIQGNTQLMQRLSLKSTFWAKQQHQKNKQKKTQWDSVWIADSRAPGGSLRTVLASSSPLPRLCGHSLQTGAATMRGWRTHGDNHVCLKLFGLFTFAGNFRADYFPALTDGAIKRSWVRNLEKFQGCLCFSSCWISQLVSLRLSTWKYGTQLIRMRWRQLKRLIGSLFERFVGNFIGFTSVQSKFHCVFLCVNV